MSDETLFTLARIVMAGLQSAAGGLLLAYAPRLPAPLGRRQAVMAAFVVAASPIWVYLRN